MRTLLLLAVLAPFAGAENAVTRIPAAPRFSIPVFDRGRVPFMIRARIAKERGDLIRDLEDPRIERFSLPLAKAYLNDVVGRLLSGSALDAAGAALYVHLNDSSWDLPGAEMGSGGVLKASPELIGVMGSEDEVAAVIGHEIAHYLCGHNEQIAMLRRRHPVREGRDMFDPPRYSRQEREARWNHELEADAVGLRLMVNAGYDPSAAVDAKQAIIHEIDTEPMYAFFRGREDPLHPPMEVRIAKIREAIAREAMTASPRRREGLAKVQEEIADRRRPSGGPSARERKDEYRRSAKRTGL